MSSFRPCKEKSCGKNLSEGEIVQYSLSDLTIKTISLKTLLVKPSKTKST